MTRELTSEPVFFITEDIDSNSYFNSSEVVFNLDNEQYWSRIIRNGLIFDWQTFGNREEAIDYVWKKRKEYRIIDDDVIFHKNNRGNWLKEIEKIIDDFNNTWKPPHISTGSNGETVLEWWNEDKKLTIYMEDEKIHFVRSWGTDIHTEMQDGYLTSSNVFIGLWCWLKIRDY